MIRSLLPLLLLVFVVPLGAAEGQPLHPDDLHGLWVVDDSALSPEQQPAATAAQAVEGFGLMLSLRTARVIFSADEIVTGMWRLEDATPDSATLVVQSKGGEAHSYHLTRDGERLVVAEAPGRLPLIRSR